MQATIVKVKRISTVVKTILLRQKSIRYFVRFWCWAAPSCWYLSYRYTCWYCAREESWKPVAKNCSNTVIQGRVSCSKTLAAPCFWPLLPKGELLSMCNILLNTREHGGANGRDRRPNKTQSAPTCQTGASPLCQVAKRRRKGYEDRKTEAWQYIRSPKSKQIAQRGRTQNPRGKREHSGIVKINLSPAINCTHYRISMKLLKNKWRRGVNFLITKWSIKCQRNLRSTYLLIHLAHVPPLVGSINTKVKICHTHKSSAKRQTAPYRWISNN